MCEHDFCNMMHLCENKDMIVNKNWSSVNNHERTNQETWVKIITKMGRRTINDLLWLSEHQTLVTIQYTTCEGMLSTSNITQCTLLKCRNILELKYLENWQCVNFKQLSFFCTRTLLIIHWKPKKVDLLLFGTYAVWNYVFGHINNVVCPGQQFSTQNIYSLLV